MTGHGSHPCGLCAFRRHTQAGPAAAKAEVPSADWAKALTPAQRSTPTPTHPKFRRGWTRSNQPQNTLRASAAQPPNHRPHGAAGHLRAAPRRARACCALFGAPRLERTDGSEPMTKKKIICSRTRAFYEHLRAASAPTTTGRGPLRLLPPPPQPVGHPAHLLVCVHSVGTGSLGTAFLRWACARRGRPGCNEVNSGGPGQSGVQRRCAVHLGRARRGGRRPDRWSARKGRRRVEW